MKKTILSIIAIFLLTFAQANNDALIFNAMKTEMDRSVEGLKLPNMPAPFYISFIVAEGETIDITASLGAIVRSNHQPIVRSAWVRALPESPQLTSDARFVNQGSAVSTTIENNANQIRRSLWSAVDADYKRNLELLIHKRNALRRMNLTEEERNLADFNLPRGVRSVTQPGNRRTFSKNELENKMRTLSEIFKRYPKIQSSSVTFSAQQSAFYLVNSQGSEIKEPSANVQIKIRATIQAEDGAVLRDEKNIVVENIQQLPSQAELVRIVNKFADDLVKLAAAPPIREYYSGPVLFEGEAVADIFIRNLLTPSGVVFSRRPIVAGNPEYTPNRPIGRKVIDTRITVRNHTRMNTYKGRHLVGAYTIDAEGVTPQANQLLVERGLLRSILNASVPNEIAPHSNGNLRFGATPVRIMTEIQPAVLEITSVQTVSPAEIRRQLLNSAKEEGLSYAYIVRSLSGAERIYQVDVNTGRETLMRSPDFGTITASRFAAVSNNEHIENRMLTSGFNNRPEAFPMSIICPGGVLLQDIEIKRQTGNMETLPPVRNPTER